MFWAAQEVQTQRFFDIAWGAGRWTWADFTRYSHDNPLRLRKSARSGTADRATFAHGQNPVRHGPQTTDWAWRRPLRGSWGNSGRLGRTGEHRCQVQLRRHGSVSGLLRAPSWGVGRGSDPDFVKHRARRKVAAGHSYRALPLSHTFDAIRCISR